MESGLIWMLEGKENDVGLEDLTYTYSRSQVTQETGVVQKSTNKYRDLSMNTRLIGMMEGKEIDVGLEDLSYTYSRSQVTKETGALE